MATPTAAERREASGLDLGAGKPMPKIRRSPVLNRKHESAKTMGPVGLGGLRRTDDAKKSPQAADPIEEVDKDSVLANVSTMPGYRRKTKDEDRADLIAEAKKRHNENVRLERI